MTVLRALQRLIGGIMLGLESSWIKDPIQKSCAAFLALFRTQMRFSGGSSLWTRLGHPDVALLLLFATKSHGASSSSWQDCGQEKSLSLLHMNTPLIWQAWCMHNTHRNVCSAPYKAAPAQRRSKKKPSDLLQAIKHMDNLSSRVLLNSTNKKSVQIVVIADLGIIAMQCSRLGTHSQCMVHKWVDKCFRIYDTLSK